MVFVQTEGLVPGSYEMARLRFAHVETLLPFSCLIGLFLDGSGEGFHELELILREQPLQLHPKPPQKRIWRGSTVAHFAGNNMLVLYSCPANNSSKYLVQVLHNEHPTPMPVSLLSSIIQQKAKLNDLLQDCFCLVEC
ncbi:histidine acid phosphatase family protein [Abeliophyllum distichum]|uniref:Histidine acid phosphatase family protein n=1 Tax=Abeliophyllum distichum TaxID=126358 RepID=A0ABD1UNL8_9LAMI